MAIKDYNGNTPSSTSYATTTDSGLMSAEDKTKLDSLEIIDTLPIGSEVFYNEDLDIPDGWEEAESETNTSTGSNPNLLINGDFQIWQRALRIENITNDRNPTYIADMWYCGNGIDSISCHRTDNKGITIDSVSGNNTIICQYLTGYNSIDTSKNYTISAKINGSIITETMQITNAVTQFDNFLLIISKRQPTLQMRINTGDVIDWVKVEEGDIATPFMGKSYNEEYRECRNYYIIGHNFYTSNASSMQTSSTTFIIPIPMRPNFYYNLGTAKLETTTSPSFTVGSPANDVECTVDNIMVESNRDNANIYVIITINHDDLDMNTYNSFARYIQGDLTIEFKY